MKISNRFLFIICLGLFFTHNSVAQHSVQIHNMNFEGSMIDVLEKHENQLLLKNYNTPSLALIKNSTVPDYGALNLMHLNSQQGMSKGGAIALGAVAGFAVVYGLAVISCRGSNDYGVCESTAPIVGIVVGAPLGALFGAALSKNKSTGGGMYERRRR